MSYKPKTQQQWLDMMARSRWKELPPDSYCQGPLATELEDRVAALLGKPKALFFHKARAAQQLVLQHWCETAGSRNIVVHPQSHLQQDELQTYQYLVGLRGIALGRSYFPFDEEQLAKITDRVGA